MDNDLKCKDCTERFVGCHATCEHYITWRKNRDELKKKMKKERWLEGLAK